MMISLRDVASESITAYSTTPREEWVLAWPGQIVQSGSCVHYTLEVRYISNYSIVSLLFKSVYSY